MAGASLEVALAATAAGGNPRLLAGVAADGRRQGVPVIDLTAEEEKEGVATPRGEGVPVIDLAAPGEDEEEGQGVGGPRAGSVPVIDLTEEGSDEEGEQEVSGWGSTRRPRASCSSAMATSPSPWRSLPVRLGRQHRRHFSRLLWIVCFSFLDFPILMIYS